MITSRKELVLAVVTWMAVSFGLIWLIRYLAAQDPTNNPECNEGWAQVLSTIMFGGNSYYPCGYDNGYTTDYCQPVELDPVNAGGCDLAIANGQLAYDNTKNYWDAFIWRLGIPLYVAGIGGILKYGYKNNSQHEDTEPAVSSATSMVATAPAPQTESQISSYGSIATAITANSFVKKTLSFCMKYGAAIALHGGLLALYAAVSYYLYWDIKCQQGQAELNFVFSTSACSFSPIVNDDGCMVGSDFACLDTSPPSIYAVGEDARQSALKNDVAPVASILGVAALSQVFSCLWGRRCGRQTEGGQRLLDNVVSSQNEDHFADSIDTTNSRFPRLSRQQ